MSVPASVVLRVALLVVLASLAAPTSAGAAPSVGAPAVIGSWGAWRAATHRVAGRAVCYAFTRAIRSTPALPGRGDVVLSVTERHGAPADAVALSAGFTYPAAAEVLVAAGHAHLRFYTSGRSAFARSGPAAADAFRHADRLVTRSTAPRGRTVEDVFSLDGFADAQRAIIGACPRHA